MDLGWGAQNQAVGNAAAKALLAASQAQERAVEDELSRYDALLQDDTALEQLRARRLAQLQQAQRERQAQLAAGHGTYVELGAGQDTRDVAKEFFDATKQSERVVVHFYRPTTRLCDTLHAHLQKLAPKHLETRFCKINVANAEQDGGGVGFLCERLNVSVLPALVIIHKRQAVHQMRGFDELGGTDQFTTNQLAQVLSTHGALDLQEDEEPQED